MFGEDYVTQTSHDSEISRLRKMIGALEIRLELIETTIKSDPKLLEEYTKAWRVLSEKRMKNDLEWMRSGL